MKNEVITTDINSLLDKKQEEPKIIKPKKIKQKRGIFGRVLNIIIQVIVLIVMAFIVLFVSQGGLTQIDKILNDAAYRMNIIYIVVAFILLSLVTVLYYKIEEPEFMKSNENRLMLFSIFIISSIINLIAGNVNIYARPFALCAVLSLFLINKKSAVFNNIVFCLLLLLFDSLTTESAFEYTREMVLSIFITLVSGIVGVYILDKKSSRLSVFLYGAVVSIPTVISAVALEFSFDIMKVLTVFTSSLISGILATSLLLILLPLFEKIFKKLTVFRIAELIDHKAKLIQDMQKYAPGTFNHSIIVANLVEACAESIGENSLLARACAYYHDVGKIKNAEYFTENQEGYNPHNDITPELSADIIKAHTIHGAELIHKFGLPEEFADSCLQHHGTLSIKYFYLKAQQYKDGDLSIDEFCYEGPKPQNKINAILMICDASEAKVRSLENRTHESVDKAVKEIIEERMDADQFTDCPITLKDLAQVRQTIVNQLSGVYHSRVKYPKIKAGQKSE